MRRIGYARRCFEHAYHDEWKFTFNLRHNLCGRIEVRPNCESLADRFTRRDVLLLGQKLIRLPPPGGRRQFRTAAATLRRTGERHS